MISTSAREYEKVTLGRINHEGKEMQFNPSDHANPVWRHQNLALNDCMYTQYTSFRNLQYDSTPIDILKPIVQVNGLTSFQLWTTIQ
jgi:hypothetical protein